MLANLWKKNSKQKLNFNEKKYCIRLALNASMAAKSFFSMYHFHTPAALTFYDSGSSNTRSWSEAIKNRNAQEESSKNVLRQLWSEFLSTNVICIPPYVC